MTEPTGLRVEVSDGLAQLVIDRVQKRNALSRSMWAEIPGLLADLAADRS
jgi:enoyl-CoA hydratase/carnithine racemase